MNSPYPLAISLSNFGITEIGLILLIVLLLFGGRKLPELARALGKSLREFKKGQTESDTGSVEEEDQKPAK